MSISKLKVDNHDVLISREIEQAPIKTMVRELVQNGFEAEREYKYQKKVVEFYATALEFENGETVKKLSIKNNGVGMTDKELYTSTNLSASIRKTMGKNHNYGIGGKVSGLRSNPEGMRYRSCCEGVVSEVTILKEGDFYGREKDEDTNAEVFNVTDEYTEYDVLEDWTEVTLYGNKITDNTISNPFGSDYPVSENWLNVLLNHRYYRFPKNTDVIYHEGILSKAQGKRNLPSWEEMINNKPTIKHETVATECGYSIIYALNKAEGWNVHRHSAKSCGSLVYKNEMFDVASGNNDKLITKSWGQTAPKLGIPFGSRDLCVFVELDDDYPVSMNAYRNEIQSSIGEKISLEDFGREIAELMPQWVKEFIDTERNKHNGSNDSMKKRIAELIKNLALSQNQYQPRKNGAVLTEPLNGTTGVFRDGLPTNKRPKKKRYIVAKPGGKKPSSINKGLRDMPEWSFITEKLEVSEKGLDGYAASYVNEANQIFINATHHIFKQKQSELENEFASVMSNETGSKVVLQHYQDEYAFNLISSVIFARSEWKQNRWDTEMLKDATSKPSLTISLAKDSAMIGRIKTRLGNNSELKAIKLVVSNG